MELQSRAMQAFNEPLPYTVKISYDESNKWKWSIFSANDELLCESPNTFLTNEQCRGDLMILKRAIEDVKLDY